MNTINELIKLAAACILKNAAIVHEEPRYISRTREVNDNDIEIISENERWSKVKVDGRTAYIPRQRGVVSRGSSGGRVDPSTVMLGSRG